MNENLRAEWYVFYIQTHSDHPNDPNKTEVMRIGASCLGDAITAAKEVANRCKMNIIGVTPDIGVPES